MAREGIPFVALGLALATACWYAQRWTPELVYGTGFFALTTGFMGFFFRDPRRQAPRQPGAVVSAADGRVVSVESIEHDQYVDGPATRISVFLSVFNVHVNRVPLEGEVDFVDRRSGRYRVAYADEASEENEQSVIGIRSGDHRLVVKQIVGILARRIACHLVPGQQVQTGERFGLIRFGSRVDLIVPGSTQIQVAVGDRVRGGETVMGVLP
jgi:phosphatidylserine decarboxylase